MMKKRSIYLTEEMDREIRILAAKTDKHYSDVVKEALTIYMDKARKKEK
jgi:Arc/MetJ-type ribon-helix-helix transcriptional regulator